MRHTDLAAPRFAWLRRLIFGSVIVLCFLIQARLFASAPETPYHFIRAIAIDPRAPDTLYVATDNQGLLKSIDGGKSWSFINTGIKNYLVYDVKVSPSTAGPLYSATWGGGFYQSDDGGASWHEFNGGLGNTAVGVIVVQRDSKDRQDRLYIGTSTELYERLGNETRWRSITDRLRVWNGPQFQNLMIAGTAPAALYLGTERGLYTKPLGARGWREVAALKGKRISALITHPLSGTLYAGTVGDGGLFVSRDQGATWRPVGTGLEKAWIRALLLHPARPKTIYIATGTGIWKSDDEGETLTAINAGLTDQDVRALAIDPSNPDRLFVGTHGAGLFRSTDGGATWTKLNGLPFDPVDKQTAVIDAQTALPPTRPALPTAFSKCNGCHGWTNPALNQKPTYWRVAATPRNWGATVARMSEGTTISPEEQEQITAFLNR